MAAGPLVVMETDLKLRGQLPVGQLVNRSDWSGIARKVDYQRKWGLVGWWTQWVVVAQEGTDRARDPRI